MAFAEEADELHPFAQAAFHHIGTERHRRRSPGHRRAGADLDGRRLAVAARSMAPAPGLQAAGYHLADHVATHTQIAGKHQGRRTAHTARLTATAPTAGGLRTAPVGVPVGQHGLIRSEDGHVKLVR
jgi:hypothetical protein